MSRPTRRLELWEIAHTEEETGRLIELYKSACPDVTLASGFLVAGIINAILKHEFPGSVQFADATLVLPLNLQAEFSPYP